MGAVIFSFVSGVILLGLVVGLFVLDSRAWRRRLMAFQLRLPAGLSGDAVATWLATVTAVGGSRWRLLDAPAIGLETVATSHGIDTFLLVPEHRRVEILATLRAALPGVRIEEKADYFLRHPKCRRATELKLTSLRRPVAAERAEATVAAYLAALQPLTADVTVHTQRLFTGSRTPHPSTLLREQEASYSLFASRNSRDRETVHAERLKHAEPLLRMCYRIGVSGTDTAHAASLINRLVGSLRLLNAPGVRVERRLLPSWWIADGLLRRALPILAWPLVLNSREAIGFAGLPIGSLHLPGLSLGAARQLPPHPAIPQRGSVVGVSNYPGMESRPIALSPNDRLRHVWVVGPTGAGKSTLLGSMILQDIERGDGVIVVDARGDLVPDLVKRIPEKRHQDVIIVDPAKRDLPVVGFNPLTAGADPELAVDNVLHILREIFRSSWGFRTADIFRASMLSLSHTKAANGSAFTLVELPTLLTNASFRRFIIQQPTLPSGLRDFWRWYERLSESEQSSVIGPVLNKLRSFLLREPLLLMLGNNDGLNLMDVFTKRRIVLFALKKGLLGEESTQLASSLFTASVWQTTLARLAVPAEQRGAAWFYNDEFQESVRLPLNISDMLSQARGAGLGLTLAHQYLGQLPDNVKTAVLGTARTHIVFQSGYDDAQTLSRSFGPLTREDLMGLENFEIALRPSVGGRTQSAVTASTLPLPPPISDGTQLIRQSLATYGQPKEKILADLAARQTVPQARVGRTMPGALS